MSDGDKKVCILPALPFPYFKWERISTLKDSSLPGCVRTGDHGGGRWEEPPTFLCLLVPQSLHLQFHPVLQPDISECWKEKRDLEEQKGPASILSFFQSPSPSVQASPQSEAHELSSQTFGSQAQLRDTTQNQLLPSIQDHGPLCPQNHQTTSGSQVFEVQLLAPSSQGY